MFWRSRKKSSTQNLDPNKGVLICDLNLNQVQKLIGRQEKKKQGFRRVIQSGNLEVITELTASGAGVGILPSRVAKRRAEAQLVPMEGGLPEFKDKICLVYRADAQKSKGSKILIEAIKKSVK